MKEEPLDLDDQGEGGLYPEAEEQGNLRSKRVGVGGDGKTRGESLY